MHLRISPTLVVPEQALRWHAVRSGGPGGQNVNKLATKVELRLCLAESALPEGVRQRLVAKERRRLSAEGELVVTCDVTRSQAQNLAEARRKLAELIRAVLVPPRRRRPTKPSRAAVARRLDAKARLKHKKAARQKPNE